MLTTTTPTTSAHVSLSQSACWKLLQTAKVGRLSYTESAMPIIRALPFVVDGGSVIVAMRRSPLWPDMFDVPTIVAFEAGEWTHHPHEGWSVHFIGKAQAVPDHDTAEIAGLGLSSWLDGEPALYVRITAEIVSGIQVFDQSLPAT